MQCSKCDGKTYVTDTRADGGYVLRRRKCCKCGYVMYTEEYESADTEYVRKKMISIQNGRKDKP